MAEQSPHLETAARLLAKGGDPALVKFYLLLAEVWLSPAHLAYLTGPVLVHPAALPPRLPRWLIEALYADRAARIHSEGQVPPDQPLGSLVEVVVYLFSYTSSVKAETIWSKIYLWASLEVLTQYAQLHQHQPAPQAVPALLRQNLTLTELPTLSPAEHQQYLQPLQRALRAQVIALAQNLPAADDYPQSALRSIDVIEALVDSRQ